jgi:hypothetical protein
MKQDGMNRGGRQKVRPTSFLRSSGRCGNSRLLREVLDGEEPRRQVGLLEAHPSRNEHDPIHRGWECVSEVVGDEPTVADPDDGVPLRRAGERSHGRGDAGGLVCRGAVCGVGGGSAEEDEVRGVGREAGGDERAEEGGPLPSGPGAEAVEEEDRVARSGGGRQEPEVQDGAVREQQGRPAETRGTEGARVTAVARESGAQAVEPPPTDAGGGGWRRGGRRRGHLSRRRWDVRGRARVGGPGLCSSCCYNFTSTEQQVGCWMPGRETGGNRKRKDTLQWLERINYFVILVSNNVSQCAVKKASA